MPAVDGNVLRVLSRLSLDTEDILKDSTNELMDHSIDDKEEFQIISIANSTDGVLNIAELRTRKHGSMAYVDLTICVNKDLTVLEGHEIAHKLEISILEELQIVKGITVHVEPCMNCKDYKNCG